MKNQYIKRTEIQYTNLSAHQNRLTVKQAALTIVGTIVGGGIVSLPHAFYINGIIAGSALLILMALQTTYSARLFMLARELLPG